MSTKTTTTNTNQYNSGSMSAFNAMTPQATGALQSEINDPYTNSAFNTQVGMARRANSVQGQSAQQAIHNNLVAQGIQPGSPLYAQQMLQASRMGQSNMAQSQNNLLLNAAGTRQQAIQSALNYKPLQTGSTNVQEQSGLGTWLPQLAGAAIGAAGMAMGNPAAAGKFAGGASMAGKLAMQAPSAINSSFGNPLFGGSMPQAAPQFGGSDMGLVGANYGSGYDGGQLPNPFLMGK